MSLNPQRARVRDRVFASAARVLAVGLVAAALGPISCKTADSLLQIDVVGDASYADVRITLSANGGPPKHYPGASFSDVEPFHAGLYVSGALVGTVDVDAIVHDGLTGACLAKGRVSVFNVVAGKISQPTPLMVSSQTGGCEGIPVVDGGGMADQTGSGGEPPGSGGGGGAGPDTGSGGASGSGGVTGSGGMSASGGALGSGGVATGSGGVAGGAGGMATGSGGIKGSGGMTSGSGGTSTGGATGSGGAGGCGALVDDLEDGNGSICAGSGRAGHWFTYIDSGASSLITPAPSDTSAALPTVLPTPRGASMYAMHVTGTYASYAGLGCLLNNPVIGEIPKTYDAGGAGYVGVRFFVKSNAGLYFALQTSATVSTTFGGTCTAASCYGASYILATSQLSSSSWVEVSVPFSTLTPGVAPFRNNDIWNIAFQPYALGAFDLWIDDVTFY